MSHELDQSVRANLMAIVRIYAKATNRSLPTISGLFHGQQTFLGRFERGECSITVQKLSTMLQDLSDDWPAGAKWPKTDRVSMGRPRKTNGKTSVNRRAA